MGRRMSWRNTTSPGISRHYFKPNDPVKMQMKSNWEASHGPWKPKPDWKP